MTKELTAIVVGSAFNEYFSQAINAKQIVQRVRSANLAEQYCFWESIRTNNIAAEDAENVKRYEDELRHRNAIITSKIVNLGSYTEYQLLILDRWLRHRNAIITLLSRK